MSQGRKTSYSLRSEINTLESRTKEKINEILKLLTDDLYLLDKDVKKVKVHDKTEIDYFKHQVGTLIADKLKLQQNVLNLESRIIQCEADVGVNYK